MQASRCVVTACRNLCNRVDRFRASTNRLRALGRAPRARQLALRPAEKAWSRSARGRSTQLRDRSPLLNSTFRVMKCGSRTACLVTRRRQWIVNGAIAAAIRMSTSMEQTLRTPHLAVESNRHEKAWHNLYIPVLISCLPRCAGSTTQAPIGRLLTGSQRRFGPGKVSSKTRLLQFASRKL